MRNASPEPPRLYDVNSERVYGTRVERARYLRGANQRAVPSNLVLQTHTEYAPRGAPHIIDLRPVFTADQRLYNDVHVIQVVARELNRLVVDAVQRYTQWSLDEIASRLTGFLSATNLDNATTRTFYVYVGAISAEDISDALTQLQKSNENVSIFNIEWRVVLHHESFFVGGSRRLKQPAWVTKNNSLCWRPHDYKGTEIGCAAFSLMWGYAQKTYKQARLSNTLKRAVEFQKRMKWGMNVAVTQLADFVKEYPNFKLIIIYPNSVHHQTVFRGAEWVHEIFLVYDAIQNHYAYVTSGIRAIQSFRGSAMRWCKHCDTVFRVKAGHECADLVVPAPRPTLLKCPKCGIYGKHTCELFTCRSCRENYKKNPAQPHRCIVYKEERKLKDSTFQGCPDAPEDAPGLWVYDIEARMETVETTQSYLYSTEVDQDGKYPEELVTVYSKSLNKHVANLIVFKQVFSNDPPVVFFGDDCLSNFLTYMLQVNGGRNVCVAHNASSYDTRLIFEAASKQSDRTSMSPIMRGGTSFFIY